MHCYTNDSLKSHSINHYMYFFLICYSTIYLWLHHCLLYNTCAYIPIARSKYRCIFLIQDDVLCLINSKCPSIAAVDVKFCSTTWLKPLIHTFSFIWVMSLSQTGTVHKIVMKSKYVMKFDWSARCIIRLGTSSTCCTHFPVVLDPRSNHSTCARTRGKAEETVRILLGMQFCMHRAVAWEEKHCTLVEYTRRTFSYDFYYPPNGKEISNTYGHTVYYVTTRTVADRMKKKYLYKY